VSSSSRLITLLSPSVSPNGSAVRPGVTTMVANCGVGPSFSSLGGIAFDVCAPTVLLLAEVGVAVGVAVGIKAGFCPNALKETATAAAAALSR
jgi:hypothetical protein